MKPIKFALYLAAAMLVTFGFGATAMAFHDGGVAHCDGCHTMHNYAGQEDDGSQVPVGVVGHDLIKGTDASSVCLSCHAGSGSYHIASTDGSNFTPGGDFYWLNKTFTWSAHGSAFASVGDNHGHNIIAADLPGFTQDATLTQAPGGSYPSSALSCASCHDPHGKKRVGGVPVGAIEVSGSYGADPATMVTGNFRLLGDDGYDAGGGVIFSADAPVATAPSLFGGPESDTSHTDYGTNASGTGMAEFCANCHSGFIAAGMHVAGKISGGMNGEATNYNNYVKTGDASGVFPSGGPYLAFTPFERPETDPTVLSASSTAGPSGPTDVVTCLSCHRAHASAFNNATRWDVETEFIADSHPAVGDGGVTGNDVLNSYVGRDMLAEFGAFQRSLCNKCHMQD